MYLLQFCPYICPGFPGGSEVESLPDNAGETDLIPGSRISSGEGNGNPLQYSCLEKPHGRRSLVGYNLWGRKESDTTERLHLKELSRPNPNTSPGFSRLLSFASFFWQLFALTAVSDRLSLLTTKLATSSSQLPSHSLETSAQEHFFPR